ncbi:hypothetical protein [Bordetella pseudohinzii]|uniref:Uncharacterized protein n=1 Tax=Bordetella pseudohinzii TaxID=1331258 RepID=A0A0M7ECA1_9BORD|nr:hypothetical protein [Bordetella pseudohinzii]CUI64594.1 Uncharacterised protein [Bordetella pseudohinzii]
MTTPLAKSYLRPGTGVGEAFTRQVRQEYAGSARIIEANAIKAE